MTALTSSLFTELVLQLGFSRNQSIRPIFTTTTATISNIFTVSMLSA